MHVANPDHLMTHDSLYYLVFSLLSVFRFPALCSPSLPKSPTPLPAGQCLGSKFGDLHSFHCDADPSLLHPLLLLSWTTMGHKTMGNFAPSPPPRAATCNIHILTSGSPTKLPSWIKRVWWLWEAIKSYEGGDFESQEQWLVQSGNLKLSKSGWWPNSKQKYIVDIALVALTEKHTNSQLANFHHLQQWTLAPPSFQPCICCPIRLLVYAKYLYVSQNCICCPGIGWDLSSDCHRHIWMCWCRTKRGGGIGAPARQWGQSTGVKIAKLVYIY